MEIKTEMQERLKKEFETYDAKVGLLGQQLDWRRDGYHSKVCGYYHETRENINFAAAVLLTDCKEYEEEAKRILDLICDVQDTDPKSKTFGLWAYLYEEPLPEMIVPDYNWADFIGKWLVSILIRCPEKLGEPLLSKVKTAAKNAAICSIRRNVGSDYTNIALMGALLQITAGEILEDTEIFEIGKARLKKLLAFTEYHTAFTEYNSSCYTIVAIDEVAKMLALFQDGECLEIAKKLNVYAWNQLSLHYNDSIRQLAPPQLRSYQDLDNGRVSAMVALGTHGRYGEIPEGYRFGLDTCVFPPECPEELLSDFDFGKERFIRHAFFKAKNDCPLEGHSGMHDMVAYTYMTPTCTLGCLSGADLWVQRRPFMAIWGKENPAFLRLRCIRDDYDFCSGIVHANQVNNTALAAVGFATDHGSFHFVLDENKSGVYACNRLLFRLEFGGYTDKLEMKQEGDRITVTDRGTEICVIIKEWKYNGNPGKIVVDSKNKCIDLVAADTPCTVDLNTVDTTYGVFSVTVNGEGIVPEISEAEDRVYVSLENQPDVKLTIPAKPLSFDENFKTE